MHTGCVSEHGAEYGDHSLHLGVPDPVVMSGERHRAHTPVDDGGALVDLITK